MFASAERTLPVPWATARRGLEAAIADGGLVDASRHAEAAGASYVVAVGPRGAGGPTRDVSVRLAPAIVVGESLALPIRWEAPGTTGKLFPALDADLLLDPGEAPATTRVRILARYEPPLGAVGRVADRVLMARVANATMSAFVEAVEARILACASELDEPPADDRGR